MSSGAGLRGKSDVSSTSSGVREGWREGRAGGGGRSGTNFPSLLSPMVSRYSDAGRQLSSAAAEEHGV